MVMPELALKLDERYTYSDYADWPEQPRYELIDGVAYAMSAPTVVHQRAVTRIGLQLGNALKGKPCEVFHAPFDVRLNAEAGDDTVVQPDLVVICDKSKIANGKHCLGAPDLVVEVLSQSTQAQDRFRKLKAYCKAGVREYWVVDPEYKGVEKHVLENGKYVVEAYSAPEHAPATVLGGALIDLADVFAE
jgi:Uma2 family endonuclease